MRQLLRINAAIVFLSASMATMVGQITPPARERKVALIVGNDEYRYVTHLKTAVNDAWAMQAILRDRYGFETTLLIDATRAQIMAALISYRRTLGPDSSLLIYYAGHGYADPAVDESYWWPIDAKAEDNSEWISADDITKGVKALSARHVLIVSDSCFSGTLSRGVTASNNFASGGDRAATLQKLRARPSRELFASGGDEPVADGGAGDHSIFAGAFLRALQAMEPAEFAVEEIFRAVRESVGGRSSQLPQLDPIRNSGHDGGSFVFSRVADFAPVSAVPAAEPAKSPDRAPSIPSEPGPQDAQSTPSPPELEKLRKDFGDLALKAGALNDRLDTANRAAKGTGGLPLDLKVAWNGMNHELDLAASALDHKDLVGYQSAIGRSRQYMATIEQELVKQ